MKIPTNTVSCNFAPLRKRAFKQLAINMNTSMGKLAEKTINERWGDELDRLEREIERRDMQLNGKTS